MPTPPPRPPATEPKPSKPRTSAKGGRKASKAAQSPLGDASSAAPPLLADPVAGWTGQAEVPPVSLHASLAAERGGAPGGAKAEACIREYNRLRLLASEEENERVASSGGKCVLSRFLTMTVNKRGGGGASPALLPTPHLVFLVSLQERGRQEEVSAP